MKEEIRKLVDEAEARAEKATAGPWVVNSSGGVGHPNYSPVCEVGAPDVDAEFIAHARQDVPALCAAIREIDQEKESIKGAWLDFYRASKSLDNDLGSDTKKREKLWERFGETRAALRALGVDI